MSSQAVKLYHERVVEHSYIFKKVSKSYRILPIRGNEFKGLGGGEGIQRRGEEIQWEGVEKGFKKRKEEKKKERRKREKKGEGK